MYSSVSGMEVYSSSASEVTECIRDGGVQSCIRSDRAV